MILKTCFPHATVGGKGTIQHGLLFENYKKLMISYWEKQ